MIINVVIVALLLLGGYMGYRRGFMTVAADLVGLTMALIVATLLHRPLGQFISSHFRIIPSFGDAVAYLLIVASFQLTYALLVNLLLRKIPARLIHSPVNRIAGILANLVRITVFIMIGLVVFAALPISAGQKQLVTSASIPRTLLAYSGGLQQAFNHQFGRAISDSLNFFTVDPESDKTVQLGFTTTNIKIDEEDEARMLVLVNHERTSRGLNALIANPGAQKVARAHSTDMFARGYFSHITSEGVNPFERMKAGGVEFGAAGENLALAPTLNLAHNGLMNSPGHKANILSPNYRTVGIGIIDGGPYGLMITQDFTD